MHVYINSHNPFFSHLKSEYFYFLNINYMVLRKTVTISIDTTDYSYDVKDRSWKVRFDNIVNFVPDEMIIKTFTGQTWASSGLDVWSAVWSDLTNDILFPFYLPENGVGVMKSNLDVRFTLGSALQGSYKFAIRLPNGDNENPQDTFFISFQIEFVKY